MGKIRFDGVSKFMGGLSFTPKEENSGGLVWTFFHAERREFWWSGIHT
jgi:hypothetical protein